MTNQVSELVKRDASPPTDGKSVQSVFNCLDRFML